MKQIMKYECNEANIIREGSREKTGLHYSTAGTYLGCFKMISCTVKQCNNDYWYGMT